MNKEFISVELLMNYITAERTTAQKKYAGGRRYGSSVAYGYAVALYKMSEFIENNKISIGEKNEEKEKAPDGAGAERNS